MNRFMSFAVLVAAIGLAVLTPLARADFIYSDFSSTAGLMLVEEARQVGAAIRLTPATGFVTFAQDRGAAWFATPQEIRAGFSTTFQCQITDPVTGGGQGFAFVVRTDPLDTIGNGGFNLGYDQINNNLAVEFDTRQQPQLGDPSDNHIAVMAGVGISIRRTKTNDGDVEASVAEAHGSTQERVLLACAQLQVRGGEQGSM